MICIENEAALKELPDKSKNFWKKLASQMILLLGTEKKESKKLKNFQKLLEQISLRVLSAKEKVEPEHERKCLRGN